jgi:inositol-phosphate phosphatase / L-galactose 1-phosphate phosphatase / histidinol-phosphatase
MRAAMTEDDIALAQRLADAAGAAIRPFFRSRYAFESKADASPVTEADRAAEAAIRAILEIERPADGIIGEEYGVTREGAERRWVLDPIDGTRSFMTGRPIFGTLIALLEGETPVLGIIDQPISRERWIGAQGRPTLFNDQPVRTRHCATLAAAHLGTTSPYLFDAETRPGFEVVAAKAGNLVLGGDCYSYGLVALGQLDLVIESGLKLHDFAALVPVVEGAGGRMCDWTGKPLGADSDGRVIAGGDAALVSATLELLC